MSLGDRLRGAIRASGPMTVAAFMDACLHDPEGGYYARGPSIGGAGMDFYTAASFPAFPRAIARLARAVGDALGEPPRVMEYGPGTGAVARALRDEEGVHVHALLETSPALAAALAEEGFRVASTAADAGPFRGLVLANEVVDAFPVHRVVRRGGRLLERVVDVDPSGRFVETDGPPPPEALVGEVGSVADAVPEGGIVEVNARAAAFVADVASALEGGLAVLVDYGAEGRETAEAHPRGTLRAYAKHRVADWLDPEPGTADLTADVDFAQLARLGAARGLRVLGPVSQSSFLLDLDAAEDYLEVARTDPAEALKAKTLFMPGGMGERFQALGLSRGLEGAIPGFRKPWETRG